MKVTAIVIGLAAPLLVTGSYKTSHAQNQTARYQRAQYDQGDRGYDRGDRDDRNGRVFQQFTDHDRRVLQDWYRDHADEMEPRRGDQWRDEDIERALQRGGRLDEDVMRWARPLPGELRDRLDPIPDDWRYMMIGYNVVIMEPDGDVRDVYHFDQFSDRDRQEIREWNQNHPNALNQFLRNFGMQVNDGELDQRLQVGDVVTPDLQQRSRPAPEELVERLTPVPRDWQYVVIGDRLCLVDRDWRVHESFHFQR